MFEAISQQLPPEIITALCTYGADISSRDKRGRTARDYAKLLGNASYVDAIDTFLLETIRSKDGTKVEGWVLRSYDHVTDVARQECALTKKIREQIEHDWTMKEMGRLLENVSKIQVDINVHVLTANIQ